MKFGKSSLLTKIVVIVPLVAATITLVSLQSQLTEKEAELAQLEEQATVISQENERLEEVIASAGTEEGVKSIAREKLGMVERNEIVFYDIGS